MTSTMPPPGTVVTEQEPTLTEPEPHSKGRGVTTEKQKGKKKTVTFADVDGPATSVPKRRVRSVG
jgi:hypothetical protein